MKHIEAITKIYFTMEYNKFHLLKGNRTLNQNKIKKIIAEIEGGLNWLPYCPIIVDADMNVIDGQHRLEVAKRINSSIWYVIAGAATLHAIAKLNTNTERWKAKDFINCYKENGDANYEKLDAFLKKFNFPFTMTLNLLEHGTCSTGGSHSVERFESGQWKCKYLDKATELGTLVYRCKDFNGFLKRNFIVAMSRLKEANMADIEELMTKFHKNHSQCLTAVSVKDYMNALEAIYNLGNKFRRVIF